MKKSAIFFIALALVISLNTATSAATPANSQTSMFNVGSSTVSVQVPSSWFVTKKATQSEPISTYGLSGLTLGNTTRANKTVFAAYNPVTKGQLIILLKDNPSSNSVDNLSALTDQQIDVLVDASMAQKSADCNAIARKTIGNMKYIYSEFGTPLNTIQYSTLLNGYQIIFALTSSNKAAISGDDRIAFDGVMAGATYSNVANSGSTQLLLTLVIIAGAVAAALLIYFIIRSGRTAIDVNKSEYASFTVISGGLKYICAREIIGLLMNIWSVATTGGLMRIFAVVLILLQIADLILLFARKRAFIINHILLAVLAIVLNVFLLSYGYAILLAVIEVLIIRYFFTSPRIAILYKTRPVVIKDDFDIPTEPSVNSAGLSADRGTTVFEQMTPGENIEKMTAHFTSRSVGDIECPVCRKMQQSNRNSCFRCGCQFIYDDENNTSMVQPE